MFHYESGQNLWVKKIFQILVYSIKSLSRETSWNSPKNVKFGPNMSRTSSNDDLMTFHYKSGQKLWVKKNISDFSIFYQISKYGEKSKLSKIMLDLVLTWAENLVMMTWWRFTMNMGKSYEWKIIFQILVYSIKSLSTVKCWNYQK